VIKVNLLATVPGAAAPREWLPREQRSAAAGLGLLVVTALAIGGWWYVLSRQQAAIEATTVRQQAELTRLKDAAKLVDQLAARKAELSQRVDLIQRLRDVKRAPVSLLETVSRSLPDGLWLMDLKQTGVVVQIDGRAMSLTPVTDLAERLQNSGLFQRPVEIVTTTTETVENTEVVRFSMKAQTLQPVAPDGADAPAPRPGPTTARAAVTVAAPQAGV
jgi:type IV pilus assembly protein PilN